MLREGSLVRFALTERMVTVMEIYAGIITVCLKSVTCDKGKVGIMEYAGVASGLFFVQILPMVAECLMIKVEVFCRFSFYAT